ncbi:hypothetical protein CFAM422_001373 [Trichoderma lentiforme]|uniref:IBR domain-containing protein n=1 Tax=Trichoderma lentiforme TaxID=1567552 RepID=A0A9P5CFM6_9HYPO|nr:hypothetical protein CFAM422_001373 [Trichoderma lentiforme]
MSDEIDQATFNLIMELQLQDAKHHQAEQSDAELALQVYYSELESLAATSSDQAIARSMAHAALNDGDFIRNHLEEEQQAVRDREYAMNGYPSAVVPNITTPDKVIEDGMIKKLAALYNGVVDDPCSTVGEPSSRQTTRADKLSSAPMKGRCLACMEDVPFSETVQCPCSHEYCRACIAKLFKAAMSDESLYPPRCCGQSIPLGMNQIFLPAELVREYREKELEYSTQNRTYCHRPSCSAFIPQQSIQGDIAVCTKCRKKTCTFCKGKSHKKGHCPADAATLDLLRIASENGWQRCYSCRTLVDLSTGCNHITRQHAAAAPSFVMYVERSGKRAHVISGMKIGWSIEQMLSLIGMQMDVNWKESSGLFLWNRQETTWFKTISACIGTGDLAWTSFDAMSVINGRRTASTNAVIVVF